MSDILAILDKEKDYLVQLTDYLKLKKEFNFTVVAFTDGAAYLEYEESNPVAILLYQDSYDEGIIKQSKATQKIALIETKSPQNENDRKSIFKFQSAMFLIKDILKYYEGTQGIHIMDGASNNLCVIGICSPAQDPSINYIGLSLAYEYGKTRRTLLLSFDTFLNSKIFGARDEVQSISDLIYFVKQKNNNLSLKIASIINKKETFDYIVGVSHWIDLFELMEEEVDQLFHETKTNLGYEVIIIDMGSFNHLTLTIMEQCDYIYEIISKGEIYREKQRELHRQVTLKKGESLIKKFLSISPVCIDLDIDPWSVVKEGKINQYAKELIAKEGTIIGTGERL